MTKKEFKHRWEKNDSGDGITYDDIADCYTQWRLGSYPKTKPINLIRYKVLKAANTIDAEEFKPEEN